MAIIKETGNSKCWHNVEKLKPSYLADENLKGTAALEKSLAVTQNVKCKVTT